MNPIQSILLALSLLPAALSTPIAGQPIEPPPLEPGELHNLQAHQPFWNFDLFHNKHCHGTTVSYAGQGSSACRNNPEIGGAEAFINVNINPRCMVVLFNDNKCSHRAKVDEITSRTTTQCKVLSHKKKVHSFEVWC
jgi:hypothetical protein